jgi:hypothetical protein
MQLWRGKGAARIALTVMLSVLGLASLLIGPVQWLTAGHSWTEMFAGVSVYDATFAVSRLVHMSAVITATILMYRRSVNRYIGAELRSVR